MKLLDIFSAKKVKATCFFLGWIAEKYPHLVSEATTRGCEIASHGYGHKLVYQMTENEFFEDAIKSKKIIEDITGNQVYGYRSAGFSTTKKTPWFFDKLIEAGYSYDSSVFPGPHGHGGIETERFAPYILIQNSNQIVEFPITVAKVMGRPMCFFGGGYLRVFPYFLIRAIALNVLKEKRPVIFYVHPREIDPEQYRLPMNLKRKFKSYINLRTTESKINRILDEFEISSFRQFITTYKIEPPQ